MQVTKPLKPAQAVLFMCELFDSRLRLDSINHARCEEDNSFLTGEDEYYMEIFGLNFKIKLSFLMPEHRDGLYRDLVAALGKLDTPEAE
jgi:hypothetical protein